MNAVAENAMEQLSQSGLGTVALLSTVIVLGAAFVAKKYVLHKQEGAHTEGKAPPYIPSTIPFLGQAVEFNKDPIGFLTTSYKQYGPVFSFSMVGKTFTYLVGSDAAAKFFESRNEDLNAEEVYQKLVTPVFGKGVAYDVPHHIFLEQKKMFKSGLNIARFTMYIPMIEEETNAYFDHNWGDSGQKDIFVALSELIILTASRCLHGKEIRSILNAEVAQLYTDLDGGFTPMAWLLPAWVPLPSFRKRDKAHIEMKKIFYEAIRKRKESGDEEEDMLQTLIETKYRSGRHMTDDEIAGMLIGLLMAGQHTSSTTTAWLSFFLAKHKDIQEACYEEQLRVSGSSLAPLNYASLKECTLLERCVKEALRLRPPLMTVMRMCKTPLNVCGYTVPVGHQVCVSPPTNQMLDDVWTNAQEFYPDRFLEDKGATSSEKFSYVPFGAGRHRCIGESFAYIQVKTIVATLLRKYELELVDNYFPTVNTKTMIHTPTDPVIRYKPRMSTN